MKQLFDVLLSDDMFLVSEDFENNTKYDPCNCLPECSDIIYRTETSEIDLQKRQPMPFSPVAFL
jgi:hypothetical protein